jgi:hypothetical protein
MRQLLCGARVGAGALLEGCGVCSRGVFVAGIGRRRVVGPVQAGTQLCWLVDLVLRR